MIISGIYENLNILLLYLVSFLVRLRTYQHPCKKKVVEGKADVGGFVWPGW